MEDKKNKQELKCGYNCEGCLCPKKIHKGGNQDPEKCEKDEKKVK